ncbi:MAG TPA: GntR family transcriptional regulator [Longimicrobiaceae bacterium]|nr:GntR family transcriptional regulator [Longimicrobiaceae bacterium]
MTAILSPHDPEGIRERVFSGFQCLPIGYLHRRDIREPIVAREWNDGQPIYRQLRDLVAEMILDGVLGEGDPLPSVRQVAAEYRVNHLTVLKGYQQLVDEQLVESRRGRGMFVNAGARDLLLRGERQKFLEEQWPRIHATIQRLGLTPQELLEAAANHRPAPAAAEEG